MMKRLKRTVAASILAIGIVSLALAACAPTAPAPAPKGVGGTPAAAATKESKPAPPSLAPLSPRVSVKLGSSRVASDAGYYIAIDKGYFDKQGLDIEYLTFGGASEMALALASGQVDVASGSPGAGFFNAIQRDVPLKVVADKGSVPPGRGFNAVVVRKDLWDSGQFRDFPDIKGKTMAIQPNSQPSEVLISRMLEKAKLKPSDLNVQGLTFPNMTAALANKAIDMALLIEPYVAEGVAKGIFARWKGADEISPNGQFSTVVYSPQFIRDKPEAAKRFMVAYVQGLRDYNLAIEKNIGKDELFGALAKWTTVKDVATIEKMVPAGLNPDGYVSMESMKEILQWSKDTGLLKREIGMEEIVDNQYVDFAIQVLGKYQK